MDSKAVVETGIKYKTWGELKELAEKWNLPDRTILLTTGLEEDFPLPAYFCYYQDHFYKREDGLIQSEIDVNSKGESLLPVPVLYFN